ncbi:MAG TPA: alcohol dehydrogenase catalytic domain-containing protein [Candidatus Dormibacteraeota bacterium]|jgi:threonine dehydrogenase-like Zn-dependent dehydrogenase
MEIGEWARPAPGREWVALRPEAAGICGSEVEGYVGRQPNRRPPLVMGHEIAGVVVEAGPGADPAWVGRRVAVNPIVSCGACGLCGAGQRNLCPDRRLIGVHDPGGFAELVVAPQANLVPLPEGMGARAGALAEPLANGVHAAGLALAGRPVTGVGVVIGAGAIGLLALQAVRAAGHARLHVLEPDLARRGLAATLGADAAHANPIELGEALRRETGRLGADFAIDAVGREQTRQLAITAVRPGGRVVLLGLHDDVTRLGVHDVVRREVLLTGSYAYTDEEFERALALLARGRAGLGELPAVEPLEAAPALFERLAAGPAAEVKLFVAPRD